MNLVSPSQVRAHLLLQDAVLLDEVLERPLLMAIEPAGEGREQELEWLGERRHAGMLLLA